MYFYRSLKKITYYHRIYEYFRKKVIKNITKIIGFSRRDYELAVEWYGCNAKRFENFMYPSNCYKSAPALTKPSGAITILLGNSADPSNNHMDAFNLLKNIANEDIKIIAPLSYGEKSYANEITQKGFAIFGEKFQPLPDLLPLNKYIELLANVDIGFFAHDRQQAMGNIITLLGMKKRVYIRNDITTWGTLTEMGIKLYNINKFNLYSENNDILESNSKIIKNYFSESNLLYQWNKVFND